MFTGLIQSLGKIHSLGQDQFTITPDQDTAKVILADLALGDSVAVDGVCLTVEEILAQGFIATASPETLMRTTLGQRTDAAEWVNLETSLRMGSKIGGHFVTGHVDGIGCLLESVQTDQAWEMSFGGVSSLSSQWRDNIVNSLVSKGSIAVNGISLTIADCDSDGQWFKVAVIPVTYRETNLRYLEQGNWVNLECDILGKYVTKFLSNAHLSNSVKPEIDQDFLAENGYL